MFVSTLLENTYFFLLLHYVVVAAVYSDSHVLRYYYTGVSDPMPGLPLFSIVQYLDDKLITKYDSDIGETRPVVKWMEKEEPEFWTKTTKHDKDWWELVFKHNIKTAMIRFNQTNGFHIVQLMYGCDLNEDGSTREYYQFGYDGRDFITLDTDRWVYIPIMHEAQISTQRWNSPEDGAGLRWKHNLENDCMESIKKYIEFGRAELERKARPQVKVSSQQSNGMTKLHCQVYGFHPRAVDVRWIMNGKDEVYSDEDRQILPNPGGTYQTRVTVVVQLERGGNYSCHVDHSSLEETLITPWEPNGKMETYVIVIIVIFVLIPLLAAAVAYIANKKWCSGTTADYVAANMDSENGGNFQESREWRRDAELPEDVNPEDGLCSLSRDGQLHIQAPRLALPAAKERPIPVTVSPTPGEGQGILPESQNSQSQPENGPTSS